MASDDTHSDLVEETPAPGTVVRHRGADIEVVRPARGEATVELHRGAAWLRAATDGPGIVLTHGAATVQVRDGAAVVEVRDFEALLVVLAGRAAVKGSAALPRSVTAGQAVTLTLDGGATDPEVLAATELAGDRMVVENLALDAIGGAPAPAAPSGAAPATTPTDASPAEPPSPDPAPVAVDGPPPAPPPPERSALESALAGVGVVDRDDPGAEHPTTPATGGPDRGAPDATGADEGRAAGRRRLLVALVVVALIVVAVVAAVLVAGDDASGAAAAPASVAVGRSPG